MAGEKDLFDGTAVETFFRNGGAACAQQLDAGFAAVAVLSKAPPAPSKLGGGGIVHQQEAALLVLHGDAVGEHLNTSRRMLSPASPASSYSAYRRGSLGVVFGDVLHGNRTCQGLL